MSSAAVIARNLGGQRQGRNWRCACPLGCGYGLSLANGEDGKLLAFCHGGCGFDDILVALVEYGLLDGDDGVALPQCEERTTNIRSAEQDAYRIERAREIYNLGSADERIAIYLNSRGITLTSPILRFSERVPHRLGVFLPGLLVPIVNVNGEQTGVHVTFLRPDGSGKANLGKEFERETRGRVRGGAIRLAAHDPQRELIIGEGIESVMSAMQIFELPGWSCVFAGNLQTLDLPPVRRITIAADHDENSCSQRNAIDAAQRWEAKGRTVRIVMPKTVGDDFNNVLAKRRG